MTDPKQKDKVISNYHHALKPKTELAIVESKCKTEEKVF